VVNGSTLQEFSPGLAGVPAAQSSVSFVNGQTGLLEYRGIQIEELAQHRSFLETASLLLYDELPAQTELDRLTADVTQHRHSTFPISDLITCLPEHGHPMDALQATVAALGMFYPARHVVDRQGQNWSAVRLVAKVPTIVAAYYRLWRVTSRFRPVMTWIMPATVCTCYPNRCRTRWSRRCWTPASSMPST